MTYTAIPEREALEQREPLKHTVLVVTLAITMCSALSSPVDLKMPTAHVHYDT